MISHEILFYFFFNFPTSMWACRSLVVWVMSSNQSDNLSNSIIVRVQCSIRVIRETFCRSIYSQRGTAWAYSSHKCGIYCASLYLLLHLQATAIKIHANYRGICNMFGFPDVPRRLVLLFEFPFYIFLFSKLSLVLIINSSSSSAGWLCGNQRTLSSGRSYRGDSNSAGSTDSAKRGVFKGTST